VHPQAIVEGATLEKQFIDSIELLQDWLARHDRELSEAHSLPWKDLAASQIAIDPHLQIQLKIPRRAPIVINASAHVKSHPLTFYFANAVAAGEAENVNGGPKSQRLGGSKSQRPKWYVYVNPPQAGCLCGLCGLRDPSQVSRGRCSSLRL